MGSVPGSMLKLLNDLLRMTTCAFGVESDV